MVSRPTGKLELTWANKDRRLIGDDEGGYTWVHASDHRVREVRLLRDAGAEGSTSPEPERARDNLLIRGDALHALTALCELPEFAEEYVGQVKLVYIDPPFNTGQAFAHYDDGLEHSVWLTMMRDRLVQIRRLLSTDGSVWVHLDDTEMAYCRVLMDEVFGRQNFVGTVVWQKSRSPRNDAAGLSAVHDYIVVFAVDAAEFAPNRLARDESSDRWYSNPDNDPRGPWRATDYTANKTADDRPNLYYPVMNPVSGKEVWPRKERVWAYSRDMYDQHVRDNLIWWGDAGSRRYPGLKRFLSEVGDIAPRTLWLADEVGHNSWGKTEVRELFPDHEPFATPKPERLLQRVIHIATDPGDVVLDCFGGSGTTAAVAHKMSRRWITVEWERTTVERFAHPRLARVVRADDPGGVTKDAGWAGGGGFRVLDVGASMYEEDAGTVVLAEWATNHALAEATAAQLGFEYDVDGPFCGRRGRTRLAVLDAMLTRDAVTFLVSSLRPGETLSAVGVGVEPGIDEFVQKLRPGSRARTAPQDLLLAYATPSAWRVAAVQRAESQTSIFDPALDATREGAPEDEVEASS